MRMVCVEEIIKEAWIQVENNNFNNAIEMLEQAIIDFEDNQYIILLELSKIYFENKQYLRALCSYPNEEFKVLERYILKKIDTNEDRVLEMLYKAKRMDSRCLII